MSTFFNVTLDQDITFDDNVINGNTGWSSQKTLEEIINHVTDLINDNGTYSDKVWSSQKTLLEIVRNRIAKFEELGDVDVSNRKNNQVVAYSDATGKFTTVDMSVIGDAAGISLKQLTKLGVNGTPSSPHIIEIPINTLDFKLPKPNILKFQLGDQNVIKTESSFTNGESNDFISDDMVIFDGTSHLKKDFSYNMTQESDIDTYKSYSVNLDGSMFKNINNLNISDSSDGSKSLNINATPPDRLLIPKGDLNLSNVANIDYFNIVASSGIKIVCSVDSGATWKTFNVDHWEDINLTVDDVKLKGLDINTFNNLSSLFWNMLVTTHKIRFAYLLQDDNSIDQLTLQYDCPGYWVGAKDTEYDVVYATNNLMQIKLYISTDVKINY